MKRMIWKRALCLGVLMWLLRIGISAAGEIPGEVALGGMPFGVKFYSDGVVIVSLGEVETKDGTKKPASEAGLRSGDRILKVDGETVETSEDVRARIERATEPMELTILRGGRERTVKVEPVEAKDGGKRAGMFIRDTMAGIGTVTYILPDSGEFAGLGHGICDTEHGDLIPMDHGQVVDVTITGIVKGEPGAPGELKGSFSSEKTGVILENTACGVFGVFTSLPQSAEAEPVPVGDRSDVHPGRATLRCTVEGRDPEDYDICITDIDKTSQDNRSFTVVVTDPELLERTGGIVQGMSGSPILQDGKLVGAVTHVLVNDPTEGYGIFIENMFAAV